MKEDNNIKPLISAILNLSLKLSKCQNAKTPKTPKMTKTPKTPKTSKTPLIENFKIAKGGGQEDADGTAVGG